MAHRVEVPVLSHSQAAQIRDTHLQIGYGQLCKYEDRKVDV